MGLLESAQRTSVGHVGFETEGQNAMFSKLAVAKQVCYFSAFVQFPTQMRKFHQQMRNAVA